MSKLRWLEGNRHVVTLPIGTGPSTEKKRALFLDRDGVINRDVNFLSKPSQLTILPGASEGIRLLQERFVVIVVTNQSGIARGFFSESDLYAVHTELISRLAAEGARIDAFYYCPHHPDGTVHEYQIECECRKPHQGMLIAAADTYNIDLGRSFLVGDTPRDLQAAEAAGVTGIKLGELEGLPGGTAIADNLLVAAEMIQEMIKVSASLQGPNKRLGKNIGAA